MGILALGKKTRFGDTLRVSVLPKTRERMPSGETRLPRLMETLCLVVGDVSGFPGGVGLPPIPTSSFFGVNVGGRKPISAPGEPGRRSFSSDRRIYADTVAAVNVPAPAEIVNRYNVVVAANAGPPATFTVTATPTGVQSTDRCGALTIDQTGNKGAAATRCW